jgi:hypothetical protein
VLHFQIVWTQDLSATTDAGHEIQRAGRAQNMLDTVSEVRRLLALRSYAETKMAITDDDVVRWICGIPHLAATF